MDFSAKCQWDMQPSTFFVFEVIHTFFDFFNYTV